MIKSTCEKIMIPVNRNTNMEIPILKTNRKKTVPKRLMVFVMVRLVLLLSSISSATIFSLSRHCWNLGWWRAGFPHGQYRYFQCLNCCIEAVATVAEPVWKTGYL